MELARGHRARARQAAAPRRPAAKAKAAAQAAEEPARAPAQFMYAAAPRAARAAGMKEGKLWLSGDLATPAEKRDALRAESVQCLARGNARSAITKALESIRIMESQGLGATSAILPECMILTRAYYKLDDVAEARFYLRQCEKLVRAEPYEDETTNAALYSMLAELYMIAKEYDEARVRYAEYMRKTETLYGPNHVATSDCYNVISAFYTHRGQYAEAIDFCRRSLAIRVNQLGNNHRFTADSRYNLGLLLRLHGQPAEARREFALARQARELIFGPQSLEVAEVELSLGFTEYQLGNLGAAHELCERSYAARRAMVGKNHPDTAEALNLLDTVRTARARGEIVDESDSEGGFSSSRSGTLLPAHTGAYEQGTLSASSMGSSGFADDSRRFDRFLVQRTLDRMQQVHDAPSMSFQSRVMQTVNAHGTITAKELHARFAPRFPREVHQLIESLEEQDLLLRHTEVDGSHGSRSGSRAGVPRRDAYPGAARSIFRRRGRITGSTLQRHEDDEDDDVYPFQVSPLGSPSSKGGDAVGRGSGSGLRGGRHEDDAVNGEDNHEDAAEAKSSTPEPSASPAKPPHDASRPSWMSTMRSKQDEIQGRRGQNAQNDGRTYTFAPSREGSSRFDFTPTSSRSGAGGLAPAPQAEALQEQQGQQEQQQQQQQGRTDRGPGGSVNPASSKPTQGLTDFLERPAVPATGSSVFSFFDNYSFTKSGGAGGAGSGPSFGRSGPAEGAGSEPGGPGFGHGRGGEGFGGGFGDGAGPAGLGYGHGSGDGHGSGHGSGHGAGHGGFGTGAGPSGFGLGDGTGVAGGYFDDANGGVGTGFGDVRTPGAAPVSGHAPAGTVSTAGSVSTQRGGGLSTLQAGGVAGDRRAKMVELSGEELWKAHDVEVFCAFGLLPMLLDKRKAEQKRAAEASHVDKKDSTPVRAKITTTTSTSTKLTIKKTKKPAGPKSDTKRVHWDVLEDTEGTIWDSGVDSSDIELAEVFGDLKDEFSNKSSAKKATGGEENGDAAAKKPKEAVLIADPKRRQNMSIFAKTLMKGGRELYEVGASLRAMDLSKFGPNALASLQEFLPQGDETEAVQSFIDAGGERALLGPAERFVDAIGSVPRLPQRIRALTVMSEFDELARDAVRRIELVRTTSKRVRESTRFARLLSIILKVGNELNKGTEKGEAQGVRLASLVKLSQTKSAQNTTLLQYIVEHLIAKDPHVLEIADDFPDLAEAARCNMQTLSADVSKLGSGLAAVEHGCQAATKAGDDEDFLLAGEPFLRGARPKAAEVSGDFKGMEEAYAELCQYVGENAKAMPPEELFQQLLAFSSEFTSTVKKVRDAAARRERRNNKQRAARGAAAAKE